MLKLRGEPISISIIGAGGITTHTRTKLVEIAVIDASGVETRVECIVLRKACGRALKINQVILEDCRAVYNVDTTKLVAAGGEIDFLVGMSSPGLHKQLSMEKMRNGLSLLTTSYGPV